MGLFWAPSSRSSEKTRSFEPHDIQAMSIALDDVCKALDLTDQAKAAREVIAERIIELARRGERSPTRLRDRVLQESGLADEPPRWSGC
jgi:hypothetical protein